MNQETIEKKMFRKLKQRLEEVEADAAVVVLLKATNQDIQVLLVKRAEIATDPWSGQTALPGGKRSPKDRNMKETVVRETKEETGIDLLDGCHFLGIMEPMNLTNKPEMTVLPFVSLLDSNMDIRLNEELTEYFWLSLRNLNNKKGTAKFGRGEFPAYNLDGKTIWGLTYNIIQKLVTIFQTQS